MPINTYKAIRENLAKSRKPRLSSLVFTLSLQVSSTVFAVEQSTVWLPKKYRALKPQLLSTAVLAEKTDRCIKVVGGEMIVSKNTEDYYYFIITCRDQSASTYNLSYLFPVAGNEAELIAEQSSRLDMVPVAANEAGLIETKGLEIDAGAELEKDIFSREDALKVCQDSIAAEAVLIGRVRSEGVSVTDLEGNEVAQFRFQVGFDIKSWSGSVVRYDASCAIDRHGEAEVNLQIDRSSIIPGCLVMLRKEIDQMLDVVILENQIPALSDREDGSLAAYIPFNTSDPGGRELHYLAECVVDDSGRARLDLKARRW
ncbi:MAG: hypothetical protein WCY88_07265 [Spongiibacteraceae bacterium]